MKWNSVELDNSKNEFRDDNGVKWKYIKKKELASKYPNGGYHIVADMKRKECKGSDLILDINYPKLDLNDAEMVEELR